MISGSTPLCLINVYTVSLRAQSTSGSSSINLRFPLDPKDSDWLCSAEPFNTPPAPEPAGSWGRKIAKPASPTISSLHRSQRPAKVPCPTHSNKLIAMVSLPFGWRMCQLQPSMCTQQGSSTASTVSPARWRHRSESWGSSLCHAQVVWQQRSYWDLLSLC